MTHDVIESLRDLLFRIALDRRLFSGIVSGGIEIRQ